MLAMGDGNCELVGDGDGDGGGDDDDAFAVSAAGGLSTVAFIFMPP